MEHEKGAELRKKYYKRMMKRKSSKPREVQIVMDRTFNTSIWVLELINGIEFSTLIFNVYYFCKDIAFRDIVKQYDGELELAGIDEERFILGLHQFYNNVSQQIKKHNQYREFAEFVGSVMRLQIEKKGTVEENIINAYVCLVLQTLEYLRTNKFDLTQCAYGVSTSGELLIGNYPLPYSDLPATEYEELSYTNKLPASKIECFRIIQQLYKKHNITINSMNDLDILEETQRTHVNTTMAFFPFINEFTFDIVPQHCYNTNYAPLVNMRCLISSEPLEAKLQHRHRTLPTNGVRFEIKDITGEITGALFKEVLYNDSIHLLYRLDTTHGSLAGYYDTKSAFFYSITREVLIPQPFQNIKTLILTLYATQVLKDHSLEKAQKLFIQGAFPLAITAYIQGGKLREVYTQGISKGTDARVYKSRNPEQYNKEDRYINVIIRNLPAGQQASEEAKELAAQYGYELEPNQTFVRPFIKQVFVKKDQQQDEGKPGGKERAERKAGNPESKEGTDSK